jgi:hypothetical protein
MDRVGLVDDYTIGLTGGFDWIPSQKFFKLPKVGLWTGCYEMFRDFSFDQVRKISNAGYGMGVGIIGYSMAIRGAFLPLILNS